MNFLLGSIMSRISTRLAIVCLALVSLALATVFAQTPPAGQPPPAARPTPPRKIPPRPTAVHVVVRDQSGTLLDGARVRITGSPESITDKTGAISFPPLKDGSYRIRVDREGFITLEHEFVVRNGQPATVDLVLNAAPAPLPPPPPPPPPPEPPAPSVPESEGGPPVILSIPAFLDKNFIGRDPLKESVLACTAHSTVRLLQMRDALAEHKHADLDEVIYVVAG